MTQAVVEALSRSLLGLDAAAILDRLLEARVTSR